MLAPLDLVGVFTGKSRKTDDFPVIRPRFYSCVDPARFLIGSVDYARKAQVEHLSDQTRAVHWMAEARDVVVAAKGQPTQEVLRMLRGSFLNCLETGLSPRERAQIWYCLRSLGVPPSGLEGEKILGVIVEFFSDDGPILTYASPDKFAAALWEGGSAKSSVYEEGVASDLSQRLCHMASNFVNSFELSPDPPRSPSAGQVSFCFITPAGYRKIILSEEEVEERGLLDVYNSSVALLGALTGKEPVLSEEETQFPPMVLWDPKWVYGSFWRRSLAFFVDCLFFIVLWGAVLYFSSSTLSRSNPLGVFLIIFSVPFLTPFITAWMESSPAWGFRTVGKTLLGLGVASIRTSGGPFYPQSLARNMAKWFVSPLFLCTGYLWAFFHRYKRAWHDVLSETVVLYDAPVRKGEETLDDLRALIQEMRIED